jgi:4-amino-4-deoxy-L-arabinose transferase-like glycosyltransferase
MSTKTFQRYGWILAWLALVASTLWMRGPLPVDETRYLSVAWDMWLRGDLLVPYLNGQPYSHKPPLLFWLINFGWAIFGVTEMWARLVSPLFALACLFLTRTLACTLWPQRAWVAMAAPWLLVGTLLWSTWAPLTMFDMPLALWVISAIWGLALTGHGNRFCGWGLLAVSSGLGILTKGPVVLLFLSGPIVLAPWWSVDARAQPRRWYGSLLLALTFGVGLALAWALPAARGGGLAYQHALLWGQTADRLVHSFAHARPWWWYLQWLPVLLAPWILWPPLWRAVACAFRELDDGLKLCISWILPSVILLSLISGKQVHYLVPMLPAIALLAARSLSAYDGIARRRSQALALLPIIIPISVVMLLATLVPKGLWPGGLSVDMSVLWGAALACLGAVLLWRSWRYAHGALIPIAVTMVASLILTQVAVFHALGGTVSVQAAAQHLAVLEQRNVPVAYVGKYHGEFQFVGGLRRPLEVIGSQDAQRWLDAHPRGRLVFRLHALPPSNGPRLELVQPYRTKWIAIGSAGQLQALTGLLPVAMN